MTALLIDLKNGPFIYKIYVISGLFFLIYTCFYLATKLYLKMSNKTLNINTIRKVL